MTILQRLFKFYLNASIHVAISVFSLAWITLLKFDLPYDNNLLSFVFFATIAGYNFVKYFGLAKLHRRSLANWLKAIQTFTLISVILMAYFALQLEQATMLVIAGFGVVTFMYAIPFLPKRFFVDKNQNLRSISGLKVYLIGLVWTGVTVLLPLINEHYVLDYNVFITCIQRFVFIIALMLPFELRDLKYDSLKLGTIPQKIGVERTKILGVVLAFLFFFLELLKNDIQGRLVLIQLSIAIVLMLSIYFASPARRDTYTSFWVEAIPIVWLLLELWLNF